MKCGVLVKWGKARKNAKKESVIAYADWEILRNFPDRDVSDYVNCDGKIEAKVVLEDDGSGCCCCYCSCEHIEIKFICNKCGFSNYSHIKLMIGDEEEFLSKLVTKHLDTLDAKKMIEERRKQLDIYEAEIAKRLSK